MVRSAAPEVVRGGPAVVVAEFVSCAFAGLLDPVLDRSFGLVDERLVVGEVVLLDVTVNRRLDVYGKPRLAVLANPTPL